MPIINPHPPTPPSPEERLQQRADGFSNQLNSQFRQMTMLGKQITDFVWKNKDFSPQQVFDVFGKNGGDLVKISQAYAAMLQVYTGAAPSITPSGFTTTVNEDGTVTVATAPPA